MTGLTRRAGLSAVAAAGLGLLVGCSKTHEFTGVDITGVPYAQGFELLDGDGKMRTLTEFAGKVVVVFFGYTQCPDVCPTTLAELAQVRKLLGSKGDRVQGVFITVDPQRDSPDIVKAYATAFDPTFIGLRPADEAQVKAVTRAFKVIATVEPGKTPETYTVSHTAASYVFDTEGKPRLYEQYNIGAQALAKDIEQLL